MVITAASTRVLQVSDYITKVSVKLYPQTPTNTAVSYTHLKLYALEDESTCNEKTALAKRDAQMRAYVMARAAEVKMSSR